MATRIGLTALFLGLAALMGLTSILGSFPSDFPH